MTSAEKERRRVAHEMADIARERGTGQTENDLRVEGFSDQQIKESGPIAAQMLRQITA